MATPLDDTKNRVLTAAGPIFAEKGFRRATVREICAAAGVNLASINYYFGDKQKLYFETVRQAHQSRTEQVPMPSWATATSPAERLTGFISTLLERMIGAGMNSWENRLMMREVLEPTAACRELVEDYFRPTTEVLFGILDEIVPADTPAHTRRKIVHSVIGQCLFYRVAGQVIDMIVPEDERAEHFQTEHLAGHIANFSMAALGLGPTLGTVSQTDTR